MGGLLMTFQLSEVYEELTKQKTIAAVAKERIEHITRYLELSDEFDKAIEESKPQYEINMLRKKLNNARVRIAPWLIKEVA